MVQLLGWGRFQPSDAKRAPVAAACFISNGEERLFGKTSKCSCSVRGTGSTAGLSAAVGEGRKENTADLLKRAGGRALSASTGALVCFPVSSFSFSRVIKRGSVPAGIRPLLLGLKRPPRPHGAPGRSGVALLPLLKSNTNTRHDRGGSRRTHAGNAHKVVVQNTLENVEKFFGVIVEFFSFA